MITHNEIGNKASTRYVAIGERRSVEQQLIRSIYAKDETAFDTLVEALQTKYGSVDVTIGFGRGKWAPLMFAVHKQRDTMVHKLLQLGADPNCADRSTKKSALHSACTNGYSRIVRMLLATQKVRDINEADNDEGSTALFTAVKRGHLHCVELLLRHSLHSQVCDINVQLRTSGHSPLWVACDKGDVEMVQRLLTYKHMACAIDAKGKKGYSPLMKAVSKGHEAVVRLLLNEDPKRENPLGPPDVTAENPLRQCAAKIAVRVHKYEIMRMLLDAEGNEGALYTLDYKGRDILEYSTHVKTDRRIGEDIKRRLCNDVSGALREELPFLPQLIVQCICNMTY